MTGFVATAAASPEPPIGNDGWFPDIDPATLRAVLRLDGTVTGERLRHAAHAAISAVNAELAAWQGRHRDAGHASLAAVPAALIDGQSRLLRLYLRAVYSAVKAELCERYRDYDSAGLGHDRADALTPAIDEHRRDARWAIRDILGRTRTTVELI